MWSGILSSISTIVWLTLIGLTLQMFKGDRDGTILIAVWIFVHATIFLSMLPFVFFTGNDIFNIDDVSKWYKYYCYVASAVYHIVAFVGIFLFINETFLIAEILHCHIGIIHFCFSLFMFSFLLHDPIIFN